jgi:hypothetical protein
MRSLMVASMILWLAMAGSGCEKKTQVETSESQVVGPLKVNGRGTLLLCGTKEGSTICYYNVRLDAADGEASVLPIPGASTCLGAEWRHSGESDELLWVTGDEQQELRNFKITADGYLSDGIHCYRSQLRRHQRLLRLGSQRQDCPIAGIALYTTLPALTWGLLSDRRRCSARIDHIPAPA